MYGTEWNGDEQDLQLLLLPLVQRERAAPSLVTNVLVVQHLIERSLIAGLSCNVVWQRGGW